jgi:small RNA 2'-O-methyltransferase
MSDSLQVQRHMAIVAELLASGVRTVLDLGCGPGELLQYLAAEPQFTRVVGIDIDPQVLAEARLALNLGLPAAQDRVQVRQGSFEEFDRELAGFDAAVLVETIEHIDPQRLSRVERAVFGGLRPPLVLVTTPNQDYNVLHGLARGERRHPDHRFEWGRAKFRQWAQGVADRNRYRVGFAGIGPPDPALGSSTQMARFAAES